MSTFLKVRHELECAVIAYPIARLMADSKVGYTVVARIVFIQLVQFVSGIRETFFKCLDLLQERTGLIKSVGDLLIRNIQPKISELRSEKCRNFGGVVGEENEITIL